jgi:GNAT superfamily N-acetyltransferase
MDDVARRAVHVDMLDLALGHPSFTEDGATFVRNPEFPRIHDANFLYDVTAAAAEEIDRLLARATREYAHAALLTIRIDPWTPIPFESRVALIAAERERTLILLLAGELRGRAPAHDIRPVEDDSGWRAIRNLKRREWREHVPPSEGDPDPWDIPDGLAEVARSKSPPVRYHLAFVENEPVGFLNSWSGVDGMGQVEDLFVMPEHRHRGLGTALLHHGVAEARARGAGPVVICTNVAETPKLMYAAMGWRPVAVCRQYVIDPRG